MEGDELAHGWELGGTELKAKRRGNNRGEMSTFQAIKRSAATETPQQRKKAKTENTSKPSIEAKVISKTLEKNESGEAYVSVSS